MPLIERQIARMQARGPRLSSPRVRLTLRSLRCMSRGGAIRKLIGGAVESSSAGVGGYMQAPQGKVQSAGKVWCISYIVYYTQNPMICLGYLSKVD